MACLLFLLCLPVSSAQVFRRLPRKGWRLSDVTDESGYPSTAKQLLMIRNGYWSENLSSMCLVFKASSGFLLLCVYFHAVESFILEGSPRSFVRYPKWYHAFENTLRFEFKTRKLNGLLLYTDDGGIGTNFYEIRLYNGAIHLLFRLGNPQTSGLPAKSTSPPNVIVIGNDLNDGQWHKFGLYQYWDKVKLEVDKEEELRVLQQQDYSFGKYQTNSDIFIGGIPPNMKLEQLSYKLVRQIEHFQGSIRNVLFKTFIHGFTAPHILESDGVRESDDDYCRPGFCKNGGFCYSTDTGPKCDCASVDYEGANCEKRKDFAEATFLGDEYLVYDLTSTRNGFTSREEEISVYFKTRRPNGMLFYSGDGQDYLHVALKDGAVLARSNLGSGVVEVRADPPKNGAPLTRFNDNKWHHVVVHRRLLLSATETGTQATGSSIKSSTPAEYNSADATTVTLGSAQLDELALGSYELLFSGLNPQHQQIKHLPSSATNSKGLSALQHITIKVDGVHTDVEQVSGPFSMLTSTVAYVGGKPSNKILPQGIEVTGFVGCISRAQYKADGRRLDFLEAAAQEKHNSVVSYQGNLAFKCREITAPEPVTFRTADSFLKLPSWQAGNEGSLSLRLKTNEPNGLLLYNRGAEHNTSDFFALELIDGYAYLLLNLGSGTLRLKASTRPLHDKQWHHITIDRSGKVGSVAIDSSNTVFTTPGSASKLDLGGTLYVGGLPWHDQREMQKVTSNVWAASLRYGFVGCLKDLHINGYIADIADYLHQRHAAEVEIGCFEMIPQCPSAPCLNGGKCIEGWNRFLCDCSAAGVFVGKLCDVEPLVVNFDDGQFALLTLAEPQVSQAEDISLKFKTSRPTGALVSTATKNSLDRIELFLHNGRLELHVSFGKGLKTFPFGRALNDNTWHTAKISRKSSQLTLAVDDELPTNTVLPNGDAQQPSLMIVEYDSFLAGISGSASSDYLRKSANGDASFKGQMAAFIVNGQDVFQLVAREKAGQSILSSSLNMSASLATGGSGGGSAFVPFGRGSSAEVTTDGVGSGGNVAKHLSAVTTNPVTFTTRSGYLTLKPRLLPANSIHLFFQFRTLELNGLLIFSNGISAGDKTPPGGLSQDFICVELVNGKIRYSFNLGDGPEVVTSPLAPSVPLLNDFKWHSVTISKPASRAEQYLTVDKTVTTYKSEGVNRELNLRSALYVGGVEQKNLSAARLPAIQSKHGFRGCLASFEVNGVPVDLLGEAIRRFDVEPGCEGPAAKCTDESCANGGLCQQGWNTFNCDCSMTSYVGGTCKDESISFRFGPSPGIILFQFDRGNHPSTTGDFLALGLATNQSDAVVLRVESGSSQDFLMVEIVNGHAYVVYNLGDEDYPVGDVEHPINDNRYHVLRFVRAGKNATFQIDNFAMQSNFPIGRKLEVFNFQSQIQLGGRAIPSFWESRKKRRTLSGKIERPFEGVLSGVSFNKLRPLDLAADKDQRIRVDGDTRLLNANTLSTRHVTTMTGQQFPKLPVELADRMMGSSSLPVETTTDELIISGDGQEKGTGCMSSDQSDEDDCEYEPPSTTDLITPVMPTKRTPRPRQKTTTSAPPSVMPPAVLPAGPPALLLTTPPQTTTTLQPSSSTRRRRTSPPTTTAADEALTSTTEYGDEDESGSGCEENGYDCSTSERAEDGDDRVVDLEPFLPRPPEAEETSAAPTTTAPTTATSTTVTTSTPAPTTTSTTTTTTTTTSRTTTTTTSAAAVTDEDVNEEPERETLSVEDYRSEAPPTRRTTTTTSTSTTTTTVRPQRKTTQQVAPRESGENERRTTPKKPPPEETPAPPPVTTTVAPSSKMSIIAGVAVALIVVVIAVIILLFKCCRKQDGSYSMNDTKSYEQLSSTDLPPGSGPGGGVCPQHPTMAATAVTTVNRVTMVAPAPMQQSNGAPKIAGINTRRYKRDVKEWYV